MKNDVIMFAEAILHGDERHQEWLRNAAQAWVNGDPFEIPPTTQYITDQEFPQFVEPGRAEIWQMPDEQTVVRLNYMKKYKLDIAERCAALELENQELRAALTCAYHEYDRAVTHPDRWTDSHSKNLTRISEILSKTAPSPSAVAKVVEAAKQWVADFKAAGFGTLLSEHATTRPLIEAIEQLEAGK